MLVYIMGCNKDGDPLWDKPIEEDTWPSKDYIVALGNSLQKTARDSCAYFEITVSGDGDSGKAIHRHKDRHERQLTRANHHIPVLKHD